MNLDDPVVAYVAETNPEAPTVAHFLESEGIAAFASEDNSLVGNWTLGRLPEIHRPEVWISRADVDRAAELLTRFEQSKNGRQAERHAGSDETVEALCENCDCGSTFPAALTGTVQVCPHCQGFLDVGESDWPGDNEWDIEIDEDEASDNNAQGNDG